jgi:hypothetical protein
MLTFKSYITESNAARFKEAVESHTWSNVTKNKVSVSKSNYTAENEEGLTATFTPYSITVYKKEGRLRNPGSTKYEVYVDVNIKNPNGYGSSYSKTFGAVRGEYAADKEEKIKKAKTKASDWFKKHLGITLGDHDFLI